MLKIVSSLIEYQERFSDLFERGLGFIFKKGLEVRLDYPQSLKKLFPEAFDIACLVTDELIESLRKEELELLAGHSPALRGFDWTGYLRCSIIRILKTARLLEKIGKKIQILDLGSYFGNFSLAYRRLGYSIDALDSYRIYGKGLQSAVEKLRGEQIPIHDFETVGYDLEGIPPESYDAVLCMSVIEHVPHTPRYLLEAIGRVLKQGGHLILETPNYAYLYNRNKVKKGLSIHPPISDQYYTKIPFEGHHREYTIDEIRWLLKENRFELQEIETFNYSLYHLDSIRGIDAIRYVRMEKDPTARELILTLSQKKN